MVSHLEFIVFYVAFFLAYVFFAPYVISNQVSTEFNEVETPSCEVGGVDFLVDLAICGWGYFSFFLTLSQVSTPIAIINTLVFTPLVIGIIYIVASWLRGSG